MRRPRRPPFSSHLDLRWRAALKKSEDVPPQKFHRPSVSWRECFWRQAQRDRAIKRREAEQAQRRERLAARAPTNTHVPGSIAFAILYGDRHGRR